MEKYLQHVTESKEVKSFVEELLSDNEVANFLEKENITIDAFNEYLNVFLGYYVKCDSCKECKGLEYCKQAHKGYKPLLVNDEGVVSISYDECQYLLKDDIDKRLDYNLTLIGIKRKNDFDVYLNEKRLSVLTKIKDYLDNKPISKGLYLHGSHGSGKTYLLTYLATNLAKQNHQVIMAYYPDLVRLFKSAIPKGTTEDMIVRLKEVEVLILDDFGGETPNSYIRDEILGPILQERMEYKRLTFMSSNLNLDQLRSHLAESAKDFDVVRASRILERIHVLMEIVELEDKKDYRLD